MCPGCCLFRWCCCSKKVDKSEMSSNTYEPEGSPVGRLFIFINPKSGAGRGRETFREQLEPLLRDKQFAYEYVITEGPQHAGDIVKTRGDLKRFDAIIICSGDGLVFEVINGLLQRPTNDGFRLLQQIPIGVVPSGSGNGLLASILFANGFALPMEHKEFLSTALSIISNPNACSLPIGIYHVQTTRQHFGSFLSIGWGLLADIDIESERLRRLCGSNRFFWGALIRMANLRTYRGKLFYLEAGMQGSKDARKTPVFTTKESKQAGVTTECAGHETSSLWACPDKQNWSEPSVSAESINSNECDLWRCHESTEVPDINEPIPSSWQMVDEEFVLVYAVSTSHFSNDGFFMPHAKVDNANRIYLTYVLKKELPSKFMLAKFLSSFESGQHLEFDFCHTVEVDAFRLDPADQKGIITVDGEVVDCSNIQVSVTDLDMRVMCT